MFKAMQMMSIRPELGQHKDVLTDVLQATRMEGVLHCRLELTPPWGVGITHENGASFHVIERGGGWLRLSGGVEPLPLAAGDLIVLPHSVYHELVDSPATPAQPLAEWLSERDRYSRVRSNMLDADAPTALICGEFRFDQGGAHPLFSLMPPLIHIKGEHGHAVDWLSTALHFIGDEATAMRPGWEAIVGRMMEILFIMVLRYWIDHHPAGERGWLGALYDPQIAAALGALHQNPADDWTVDKLAAQVHMSRSAFAARFTELVGEPPLTYLTRWRIQLAAFWLRQDDLSLAEIAERAGYTSVFAFSKAFKRLTGISPGAYQRGEARV